jgi:hypothetical protein
VQLGSTKSHTQQQMERNLEGELHTVQSSNQVMLLTVPASSESNLNRKGMNCENFAMLEMFIVCYDGMHQSSRFMTNDWCSVCRYAK